MLSKNIKAKLYLIDNTMFRIWSDRRTLYAKISRSKRQRKRRWLAR